MPIGGSATTWKSTWIPACQSRASMMPIESTARASPVAARSAQPTSVKSSERSSLTSRPEDSVAGASPSILDPEIRTGGPGQERNHIQAA